MVELELPRIQARLSLVEVTPLHCVPGSWLHQYDNDTVLGCPGEAELLAISPCLPKHANASCFVLQTGHHLSSSAAWRATAERDRCAVQATVKACMGKRRGHRDRSQLLRTLNSDKSSQASCAKRWPGEESVYQGSYSRQASTLTGSHHAGLRHPS